MPFGSSLPFAINACSEGQQRATAATPGCGVWAQDADGHDLSGTLVALQLEPGDGSGGGGGGGGFVLGCDNEMAAGGLCLPGSYNMT